MELAKADLYEYDVVILTAEKEFKHFYIFCDHMAEARERAKWILSMYPDGSVWNIAQTRRSANYTQ
jgi:hypothetical protein